MTDEESRIEYAFWCSRNRIHPNEIGQAAFDQVVVWATKRERERCARIAEVAEDRCRDSKNTLPHDLSELMSFGESLAGDIRQEILGELLC